MFARTCGSVSGANPASLLSVIGVRVRSRCRILDLGENARRIEGRQADLYGTVPKLRSLPPSQDHSGLESLFETVDQRLRFERFAKQADCALGRRLSVDAQV